LAGFLQMKMINRCKRTMHTLQESTAKWEEDKGSAVYNFSKWQCLQSTGTEVYNHVSVNRKVMTCMILFTAIKNLSHFVWISDTTSNHA
jgi:hypothetical protein